MLDLRIPTGLFFALAGFVLLAVGILTPDARAPLTDFNVNLYCGLFMVAFGGVMLLLAWRAARKHS
jgi:uncharacterized membrane protein